MKNQKSSLNVMAVLTDEITPVLAGVRRKLCKSSASDNMSGEKEFQFFEKAMQKGYSTASKKAREFGFGAGMGLDNMKNCADIFEINSSKDGTHIHMVFE